MLLTVCYDRIMKQTFKQFLKENWDEMVEIAEASTGECYTGREPLLDKETIIEIAKEEYNEEKNLCNKTK